MRFTTNLSVSRPSNGFTIADLVTVLATIAIVSALMIPAMARTHVNSPAAICLNNLRQLSSSWAMYSADNSGKLVWSYPGTPCLNTWPAWCMGNADSTGASGTYCYGGTDTNGPMNGKLWPYVKNLTTYKCGADRRVATVGGVTKPILRSYSMNCYMAGRSFNDPNGDFIIANGGPQNGFFRVYLKDTEVRYPSKTFVFIDEDGISINDCMFMTDMSGFYPFIDLPTRAHDGGYGVNFADGHVEMYKMRTSDALTLSHVGSPFVGSFNVDYWALTNIATFKQN